MTLAEPILAEFRREVPSIRHILERVPQDKLGWKPHPKSRSLGELSTHVAGIVGMPAKIINADEFAAGVGSPTPVTSADEIRATFERNVLTSEEAISKLSDQAALGEWRLVFRGRELMRLPRIAALRTNVLNHIYHHRGQLTVYLRLLDVPVPPVYGPTADENPFV
jgi:uncharacterized damage-inducible protein DinB